MHPVSRQSLHQYLASHCTQYLALYPESCQLLHPVSSQPLHSVSRHCTLYLGTTPTRHCTSFYAPHLGTAPSLQALHLVYRLCIQYLGAAPNIQAVHSVSRHFTQFLGTALSTQHSHLGSLDIIPILHSSTALHTPPIIILKQGMISIKPTLIA